ncbi:MAG: ABC transporter permease subunit [Sporichthyaceae bacterium]
MDLELLKPALVLGLAQAGLYGLLPISLVLCFRISRTVAFVHGGLVVCGGVVYTVALGGLRVPYTELALPAMDPRSAFAFVVGFGALLGGAWGAFVMSRRVAALPGMTLTVMSLGAMLLATSFLPRFIEAESRAGSGPGGIADSAFGDGGLTLSGQYLPATRVATAAILVVLVVVLALFLNFTHSGLQIRAVADDLEAGVWCGVRLRRIGTAVYAVAGAIATMAGALFVATVAAASEGMLMLFLRGLIIAIVGGLVSVPLALAGAVLFGVLETGLVVGLFGTHGGGTREFVLLAAMMALILTVARLRRESFFVLGRQSL